MFLVSTANSTISAMSNAFSSGIVAIEYMTAMAIASIIGVYIVEKLVDRSNHNSVKHAQ